MAIVSVMGVMNGFQIGYIEAILNVTSFHIRIQPLKGTANHGSGSIDIGLTEEIRKIPGIETILPFRETQGMLSGVFSSPVAASLMAVPPDASQRDPLFTGQLSLSAGSFDLSDPRAIVLGSQLAFSLGVECGDTVELSSLSGREGRPLSVVTEAFVVRGIFESGYYRYDSSLALLSLEGIEPFDSGSIPLVYGVKLKNRYRDLQALEAILQLVEPRKLSAVSWRVYNRSFFSALRMEKLLLMVLLGLIFIVVGVTIRAFLRREVLKRREEIGILKAMGAPPGSICWIFVIEGFLIGFFGVTGGIILGILISGNIDTIFGFVEKVVNGIGSFIALAGSGIRGSGEEFTLFSPAYFYIKEVPSVLFPGEVIGTSLFALLVSTLAGLGASRGVSRIAVTAVLRGEERE
jgi:lipoprotein-releasing system permease protein